MWSAGQVWTRKRRLLKNENSSATLVKVEMTVESKSGAEVNSTDKTNIEAVASGKILEY